MDSKVRAGSGPNKCGAAVIVTGANGYIGRAISLSLSNNGYSVIALDRSFTRRRLLESKGLLEEPYDITTVLREGGSKFFGLVQELLSILDVDAIAGLVNNAALQVVKSYRELSNEDWERTFETNTFAPALLISAVRDKILESRGCVVNVGSVHETQSKAKFAAYASSKAALAALTRGINLEEKGALRVYTVAPGAVDTPMLREGFSSDNSFVELGRFQPLGRLAKADEVADVVVDLIARGSVLLSGSTLKLDGGIHGKLHDPD